jgi:hypothetical protein
MRKVLVVLIVAAALVLALSVPALAAQPTAKEAGSFQAQYAFAGVGNPEDPEEDFFGGVRAIEWNANQWNPTLPIPGFDKSKGGSFDCYFNDTVAMIEIWAPLDTPITPNMFVFGKQMNSATLTAAPVVLTYDGGNYPGTLEVRWEGVGDNFISDRGRASIRSPEPPGPWSMIDKHRGSFYVRFANATIAVTCPDLDYEKTVIVLLGPDYAYMLWNFEQVVVRSVTNSKGDGLPASTNKGSRRNPLHRLNSGRRLLRSSLENPIFLLRTERWPKGIQRPFRVHSSKARFLGSRDCG